MALALGCSVAELGRRMSSSEFGAWLAFFEEEPTGLGVTLDMWAELMAALHNGPLAKKDKALWRSTEFARRLWAAPAAAARKKAPPPSAAQLRAHVQALKRPAEG